MSFTLEFDSSRKTAVFTGQGCCDYVDFCVALNGLLNHALFQPGMSVVWDWRNCEILLANNQIRSLVESITRFSPPEISHKIAIVTSVMTLAPAETWQIHVESMTPLWSLRLYGDIQQAILWTNGDLMRDFTDTKTQVKGTPLPPSQSQSWNASFNYLQ